jgi:colanic acid biosynthesis glycosyl transferase WcaI
VKLLLFCPHFRPDLHAATGEVMTQLVDGLAERGHRITVVTALPWYRGHRVDAAWRGRPWRRERTDWGEVVRVWPFPTDKTNIPARLLGFGGMTSLAAALGQTVGRPDVVMAMSPPPFLGDAAWLAARRWRVPLVVNLQDIFPDVAVELGALTDGRVVGLARRHERSLYRRADAITVLSDDQARNVRAKLDAVDGDDGVDPGADDKITVIRNFVDLERIRPGERDNRYRHRHGLTGRTVVMYSGNVGLSQPFELIREAADRWSHDPDVVFVINGEGAARSEVDRWAAARDNVRIVDFGPRSEVPTILAAADLHLILLRSGLARSSTPSKFYSILAAGRPVLASIDEGSEVSSVVKEAEVGVAVPPDDPWAFCQALERLVGDREELVAMGERARAHAASCLTAAAQAEAYEALFRRLVDDRDRRTTGPGRTCPAGPRPGRRRNGNASVP